MPLLREIKKPFVIEEFKKLLLQVIEYMKNVYKTIENSNQDFHIKEIFKNDVNKQRRN